MNKYEIMVYYMHISYHNIVQKTHAMKLQFPTSLDEQ